MFLWQMACMWTPDLRTAGLQVGSYLSRTCFSNPWIANCLSTISGQNIPKVCGINYFFFFNFLFLYSSARPLSVHHSGSHLCSPAGGARYHAEAPQCPPSWYLHQVNSRHLALQSWNVLTTLGLVSNTHVAKNTSCKISDLKSVTQSKTYWWYEACM